MPITHNAIKALKQSKKRANTNAMIKARVRSELKKSTKNPVADALKMVYSTLDKAVKAGVMHKNKAARLKSQQALASKSAKLSPVVKKSAVVKKVAKKVVKKTTVKKSVSKKK